LDAERTANAFFLAATQAAGIYSPTPAKRFNTAKAVQNGILAGLLSQNQFTGVLDVFTAEVGGFCGAFADQYDVGVLGEGLGSKYHTLDVGFKVYSCSRPNHTAIDAARDLRQEHPDITPDAIEQVDIECTTPTYRFGVGFEVNTVGNAFMSLPYCVAAMLVDGNVFVDQFTEEKVRDPQMRNILSRTHSRINPEYDKGGAALRDTVKVGIRLKNGKYVEKHLVHARGHKERPLSAQELTSKFENLAGRVVDAKSVSAIEDVVQNIEQARKVEKLPGLLRVNSQMS
jgi:2-methylcitrate dehydratase PrpD